MGYALICSSRTITSNLELRVVTSNKHCVIVRQNFVKSSKILTAVHQNLTENLKILAFIIILQQ